MAETNMEPVLFSSLLVGFVCKVSYTVQYYVKFILFLIFSMISAVIFVPLMIHRPRDSRNGLLPSWGCRTTSRWLGVTYEVRGQENIIPEGEGCVVVINHQSALDLIVMANIWPLTPKGCLVVKREILWYFPFGPATWFWGTVFIDRSNPEKSQKAVNDTGEYIKSKHARVCFFPEGTRQETETLLPFKKGAFHIALAAQCSIQPVVVSKYHFLDSKNHKFGSGHNIIEFLPAIPTNGLTKEDLPQLIEITRNVMQENFTRLTEESRQLQ